jgi:RimJ/RimL family protein N-acetyltransferase
MDRVVFIKGEKIDLCVIEETDTLGNYKNWLNDQEVCLGNSHHKFPVKTTQLVQFVQSLEGNQTILVLGIYDKRSKEHVGNVSLQKIDWINRSAEFAILLGERESWGKGFGLEACKLMIKHAFDSLNLNRVYCATFESNKGMINIALKSGMKREGIRVNAVFKNGIYLDVVEFGILKDK